MLQQPKSSHRTSAAAKREQLMRLQGCKFCRMNEKIPELFWRLTSSPKGARALPEPPSWAPPTMSSLLSSASRASRAEFGPVPSGPGRLGNAAADAAAVGDDLTVTCRVCLGEAPCVCTRNTQKSFCDPASHLPSLSLRGRCSRACRSIIPLVEQMWRRLQRDMGMGAAHISLESAIHSLVKLGHTGNLVVGGGQERR